VTGDSIEPTYYLHTHRRPARPNQPPSVSIGGDWVRRM